MKPLTKAEKINKNKKKGKMTENQKQIIRDIIEEIYSDVQIGCGSHFKSTMLEMVQDRLVGRPWYHYSNLDLSKKIKRFVYSIL
jgi:hypothetical protein